MDLNKSELEQFTAAMDPEGLFLWVATESEEEESALLRKIEGWTGKQGVRRAMEEVKIEKRCCELGQGSSCRMKASPGSWTRLVQ